jgi:hypothetical protein
VQWLPTHEFARVDRVEITRYVWKIGLCSGNAVDLELEGAKFESQLGKWLSWLKLMVLSWTLLKLSVAFLL